MKISMKLAYQYIAIFLDFSPTLNHLHSLQVENCDSNSRLVVNEDDNGKFRLERVNPYPAKVIYLHFHPPYVASCYRDPQLQVDENYSHVFVLRPSSCKS